MTSPRRGRHPRPHPVRRRLLGGVGLVVGAALLLSPPADAGTAAEPRSVLMLDSGDVDRFDPALATVRQGKAIRFTNFGLRIHDADDRSGLDLFATEDLVPPAAETIDPLPGAGAYTYVCTFHPQMVGQFRVPVTASPARAPRGRRVTVRWSHARASDGLVFDVRLRPPGSARFVAWRPGVTGAVTTFRPNRRGTWSVRARVRRPATGATSGWSPIRTFRIT